MKRSSSDDLHTRLHKKPYSSSVNNTSPSSHTNPDNGSEHSISLISDTLDSDDKTNSSTNDHDFNKEKHPEPTPNNNTTMDAIQYVHNLVRHLDQGNIDNCLSQRLPDANATDYSTMDPAHLEMLHYMDSALKNIAQRQLQLETENLRYRIGMEHQHLLYKSNSIEEPVGTTPYLEEVDDDDDDDEEQTRTTRRRRHNQYSSSTTTTTTTDSTNITPEENMPPSLLDSSLVDKMHSSCQPIPPLPTVSQSSTYFGKLIVFIGRT